MVDDDKLEVLGARRKGHSALFESVVRNFFLLKNVFHGVTS